MITETGTVVPDDTQSSVSWRAILAGTIAAMAITLLLLAFGSGMGFAVVSPWANSGVSATTFTVAAGLYMIVVAMLASTIGGYVAGRLRAQWRTVHAHERYFRDTAHGFLVWALATVASAAILGGATTNLISGGAAAAGSAAQAAPSAVYIDKLMRSAPANAPTNAAPNPAGAATVATPSLADTGNAAARNGNDTAARGEINRILVPSLRKGGSISGDDRTYLAQVVATHSGMSQADAQQRVDQVNAQAKADADAARKSAAKFSIWLVVSMLAGALSASLAAVEGGSLRNREWYLET